MSLVDEKLAKKKETFFPYFITVNIVVVRISRAHTKLKALKIQGFQE